MHILYKRSLFTIAFNFNLHKKKKTGSSFQNLQNKEIRPVWPFLRLYGLKCVPSPGAPSVPKINIFPRQGEQCSVVEFSYLGYSLSKCSCNGTPNIQFTFHTIHVNILSMHILTKLTLLFIHGNNTSHINSPRTVQNHSRDFFTLSKSFGTENTVIQDLTNLHPLK